MPARPPDVHERVRALLRDRIYEITVTEVARRVGVSQPLIARWLNGHRPMPERRLYQIARACGVELEITVRLRRHP